MICCAAAAWLFGFLVLSWKGVTTRLRKPAAWTWPLAILGSAAVLSAAAAIQPAIAGSPGAATLGIARMCGEALLP